MDLPGWAHPDLCVAFIGIPKARCDGRPPVRPLDIGACGPVVPAWAGATRCKCLDRARDGRYHLPRVARQIRQTTKKGRPQPEPAPRNGHGSAPGGERKEVAKKEEKEKDTGRFRVYAQLRQQVLWQRRLLRFMRNLRQRLCLHQRWSLRLRRPVRRRVLRGQSDLR